MKSDKINHLINHVVLLIDGSTSIEQRRLTKPIIKVVDEQIRYLAELSTDMNQETRVSIYIFGSTVECPVYDRDVLRLPSIAEIYRPDGWTRLIDANLQSIKDLKLVPQLYCDHAFLVYGWTDGEENKSTGTAAQLRQTIAGLEDNWTVGIFVPDDEGRERAIGAGFPGNNIMVWETTSKGVDDVNKKIRATTKSFMQGRATGQRSMGSSLFHVDAASLTKTEVKKNLTALHHSQFFVITPVRDGSIRDIAEQKVRSYITGSGYYPLTKKETIQGGKQIIIRDAAKGTVYSGDAARDMLGLPDTDQIVKPGDFGNWEIFVQSTSVNRKILAGTDLIVLK